MNRNSVEERVLMVISSILKVPVNSESTRLEVPSWDSLKHVEVIFAIEDEFDIEFKEEILFELNSVSEIVKRICDEQ